MHVVKCRWPVSPEVGLDRPHASLVEIGQARPAWVAVQALESRAAVSRRAEAHVSLPGQRLEQRADTVGEGKAQMPEPGPGGDRRPELVAGHRPVG